ncbi:hypothetical protein BN7_6646 [Wickerhamomyces ciferrii]|uniref:ATP-dependent RNA helicase n=1 Tax=Wickerhamomyces ciferrii (strain ATCC 14091 / BCRC 22168 / CBS 111 / JCM 3599 / NBRC 0793 / NRRL Y-1031 F-60-10) TaxID=1206466 RepID=K0KY86_WICCF|nr:uncharacterized protein BN7_6646 [Wickerhamomyces ciferrii]CCH47037.1 hypothetical protein BN7_6646 [Wickerhamomyces ciferrii]
MAKKTPKLKPSKEATPPPDPKAKGKKTNDKAANGNGKSNNVSNSQSQTTDRPASTNRPSSGKTPISLLHEHAQRSKWEKVQYDMMKVKDGFVATAILQWKDPKANEMIDVKVRHDLPAKETPIEARYFAATAALHRVCFNKNLQMVLPREFKDTWGQLESERKTVLKDNKDKHDRLYTNDPFKVFIEDRKNKESKSKEREIRLNNEAKVKKTPIVLTSIKPSTTSKPSKNSQSSIHKSTNRSEGKIAKPIHRKAVTFPKKVWDNAVSFGFTVQQRELIQKIIKSHIQWKKASNTETSTKQLLLNIGFRASHVEESLQYQDPLSFLLFNVPEDDLPAYFHDVSSSNDSVTIADKNESLVRKVMDFGVGRPEAIVSLKENDQNVSNAIISLTSNLVNYKYDGELDPIESQELWEEEISSLTSIFEPQDIKIIDDGTVQMNLNDILCLKIFKSPSYPNDLAGFIVTTKDENHKIPNYVKNNLVRSLAQYSIENLLGMSYIYSLVDWLKENMAKIIENPGPLIKPKAESTTVDDLNIDDQKTTKQRRSFRSNPDTTYIKNDYEKRTQSSEFKSMVKSRTNLPAWDVQKQLIETVKSNQVSLITGETGSGKSTQLVQFLLDDLYAKGDYKTQIFCTQPRRISAIGLAERVSEERATTCGEEVGYIIRGANKSSRNTRIKFLTTGILVKFLQNGDEFLNNAILVLDEVHERSMETDLIIILLKKLLSRYKDLKVVMMSATVDLSVFQNFFKGLTTCHIKGRTFPIEDFYLDHVLSKTNFQIEMNDEWITPKADSKFFQSGNINYDLIVSLVSKIHVDLKNESNDGSILIFLPGVAEINKCVKLLNQNFDSPSVVLPLHSALTPQEQHKVFETFPGKRKIVVSTNIAETSITINDCVVTIDSGRVKSMTYNSIDNTTKLIETFESKAEAKQRRGRAGRVSKGKSYKLYTEETYEFMLNSPIPEIKRINLDSLYLVVKSMGIKDVIAFLNTGMDPPPLNSLTKSEELLKCAGLIDEYDDLTELGSFISLLPIIDPKHGKLLIFSIIFGCADIGILTASILSVGSPFIRSVDSRDEVKNILSKTKHLGDLVSTVLIVEEYFKIKTSSEKRKFMNQNHLSFTKINEISSAKTQYLSILQDIGFLPLKYKEGDQRLNKNYKNDNLIKSIITGAFYPQVARVQLPDPKFFNTSSGAIQKDPEAAQTKYWIRNEEFISSLGKEDSNEASTEELPATRAFIHPSSVMFDTSSGTSTPQNIVPSDYKTDREDGLVDFGVLQQRQIDFTPQLKSAKNKAIKSPFVVYNSSSLTSKLFLRDVTPTSTLSTLLFGGPLSYDLNSVSSGKTSPGIVLDSWLPIKTWCKNAVLVKELRLLLDQVIKSKLENPEYSSSKSSDQNNEVLDLVNLVLNIDR